MAKHSFTEEERRSFTEHLNRELSGDPDLSHLLPMDPNSPQLFQAVSSGVVLCKFINKVRPGSVDMRQVVVKKELSKFEALSNQSIALSAARTLGCKTVNIGPLDLFEGKIHLVLGIIWQLVRIQLLSQVNVGRHPELAVLCGEKEDAVKFSQLSPEENLLRWVNYHLAHANSNRRITNFDEDLKDGVVYSLLLSQVAPDEFTRASLFESSPVRRATTFLQSPAIAHCAHLISPQDILNGNSKLNTAFIASLLDKHTGIAAQQLEQSKLNAIYEAFQQKLKLEEAAMRGSLEQEAAARRVEWEREEQMKRASWDQRERDLQARLAQEEIRKREMWQAEEDRIRRMEQEARGYYAQAELTKRLQDQMEMDAQRRREEETQAHMREMMAREQTRRMAEEQTRKLQIEQQLLQEQQRKAREEQERQARQQLETQQRAAQYPTGAMAWGLVPQYAGSAPQPVPVWIKQQWGENDANEQQALKFWFSSVDQNRSGDIDADELLQAIKASGENCEKRTADIMVRIFAKKGTINFQEFASLFRFIKVMREAFEKVGGPQKVFLSPAEVHQALQHAKYHFVDPCTLTFMIQRFDKSNCSLLSFETFLELAVFLLSLRNVFSSFKWDRDGMVELSLDQFAWIINTLCAAPGSDPGPVPDFTTNPYLY